MGAGEMKILFYIILAIFLFFTAPIWVPAVGILGLATGIGAGTAIIAANHASSAAPAPAPPPSRCPCTKGRYVGGDVLDPHSYVWTWALDGREHTLAERPVNADDRLLRDWAGSDPRKRELAQNMASSWGINLQF
jgi:hypothetical protein